MFNTGNIATIDYCLELRRQLTTGERMDPFLWNKTKIKEILRQLEPELIKFYKNTVNFFSQIKKLLHNKTVIEGIFFDDLEKEF